MKKTSLKRSVDSIAKRSSPINDKLMTKDQKHLYRKIIHATMLLANSEHNLKVAQDYIGDYFTKMYVEKTYGVAVQQATRRLQRLHRKLDMLTAERLAKPRKI